MEQSLEEKYHQLQADYQMLKAAHDNLLLDLHTRIADAVWKVLHETPRPEITDGKDVLYDG